jgi:F-type H+-transporting ATPase subunit alpha
MDDNTRKIIDHGQRIRACLKQGEGAPIPAPAQIAVLLALTANLFDPIALDRMTDAQQAVQAAAATIPADARERLESANKLSDADRGSITDIARQALIPFQPAPAPAAKPAVVKAAS